MRSEEERIDLFLETFKSLESEMVMLANFDEGYTSFSRALNYVHKNELDPFVASSSVYEFLKSASDLRNILSHRNSVAAPTEEFLDRFIKIADNIIHPTLCIDIATKGENIVTASEEDKVLKLMSIMSQRFLSHIPIYRSDDNSFIGVFSRTTLFEYYLNEKNISLDEDLKIKDLEKYVDINSHKNEQYLFVDRHTKIVDVYNKLLKKSKSQKKLSCIFVTSHGKPNEVLLGIVTQIDILKLVSEIE